MDMNNLRGVLGRLEQKDSALGDGGITADEIYTAASIAPVTGEAIAVKELPDDIRTIGELFSQGYDEMDFKKMGMGAAYTAAVAAGLIPVAGVLGRMGKGVIKPLIKTAKNTDGLGALPDGDSYVGASISDNIKLNPNETDNFFGQLSSGIINDNKSLKFLKDQVEGKLDEAMMNRPEGMKFSYDENELTGILNNLEEIEKNNVFPVKLNFGDDLDAKEIYENSITGDIKEIYDVPKDNKGIGAVRMNQELLNDEYGIDLQNYTGITTSPS